MPKVAEKRLEAVQTREQVQEIREADRKCKTLAVTWNLAMRRGDQLTAAQARRERNLIIQLVKSRYNVIL